MNLAEQMQAQIALNKVLPLIQMQLANNFFCISQLSRRITGIAYSKRV